jgi:hypothetical protein
VGGFSLRICGFGFNGPHHFWREVDALSFVFESGSFVVQAFVAGEAEILLAANALCCAFLRLTFLANSDPLVIPGQDLVLPELLALQLLSMRTVIAGSAEEGFTLDAPNVDLGVFADVTSKIHS